jgi:hypothetical protein
MVVEPLVEPSFPANRPADVGYPALGVIDDIDAVKIGDIEPFTGRRKRHHGRAQKLRQFCLHCFWFALHALTLHETV